MATRRRAPTGGIGSNQYQRRGTSQAAEPARVDTFATPEPEPTRPAAHALATTSLEPHIATELAQVLGNRPLTHEQAVDLTANYHEYANAGHHAALLGAAAAHTRANPPAPDEAAGLRAATYRWAAEHQVAVDECVGCRMVDDHYGYDWHSDPDDPGGVWCADCCPTCQQGGH